MKKANYLSKITALVLCIVFVISFFDTKEIFAYNYGTIKENTFVTVTKVFDGESFEAKSTTSDTYYLVKMIGVNAKAYDDSFSYTNNRLMGKTVLLTLDRAVYSPVGRWNYCYVRENGEVVNTKMIAMGYGEADVNTSNDTIFTMYSQIEENAKADNIGMWGEKGVDGSSASGYDYTDDTININTATQSQLMYKLYDVDSKLASEIITYRRYNPFNRISDIKFVPGMTKAIYDRNVDRMHVVTNINRAKEYEISTLSKISDSDADDIISYRDKKGRITIQNLIDDKIITDAQYTANKEFITDDDITIINFANPNNAANINTSTETFLVSAGLSSSDIKGILRIQDTGFTIKTIGELQYSDEVKFSDSGLRKIMDNIKVFTDINYSLESEMRSLFGNGFTGRNEDVKDIIAGRNYTSIDQISKYLPNEKYQAVKPYIYVGNYKTNYININTATLEQMLKAGIDSETAKAIINKRKNAIINDYSDLPNASKLKSFDNVFCLYTNVNNTSVLELMSLSSKINSQFAQSIIDYSTNQPFGSLDEFYSFLKQNNKTDVYDEVKDFIVLY